MRALSVARKDFTDAVQSRALWSLVVVFVAVTAVSAYAFVEAPELIGRTAEATFGGLLFFTAAVASLFVPLAAIIVCYKSIAGERELGSIKLLMSLPATRADVFFGKVLGRGSVMVTALGVGVLIGVGFGAVLLGAVDIVAMIVFSVVTVGFAGVYTAIMVGLSGVTGSTARATTYALGFYLVFELLWDVIPLGLLYVIEGFSLPSELPDWFVTVGMISPSTAYFSGVNAVLPEMTPQADGPADGPVAGSGDALLTQPEIGFVFLACWLIGSLALGYRRFNTSDL